MIATIFVYLLKHVIVCLRHSITEHYVREVSMFLERLHQLLERRSLVFDQNDFASFGCLGECYADYDIFVIAIRYLICFSLSLFFIFLKVDEFKLSKNFSLLVGVF